MCISDLTRSKDTIQWDLFNYKKVLKARDDLIVEVIELGNCNNLLFEDKIRLVDSVKLLKEENTKLKKRISELLS